MISDTVCMQTNYAFRNIAARGKITKSVMASLSSQPHNGQMLDHNELREELIRQLDDGRVTGVEVAATLGIATPRISEMRSRNRRVQQHEMKPLADLLGLKPEVAEVVYMPVSLPSGPALIALFEGLLESADRPELAAELAPQLAQHFPTALRQSLGQQSDQDAGRAKPHAEGSPRRATDRPAQR